MVIKLLYMYLMNSLIEYNSKNSKGEIDVAINVACPGYCITQLGRDFPWYIALPTKIMHVYYVRTAEEGSRSMVSATLHGKTRYGKFQANNVSEE